MESKSRETAELAFSLTELLGMLWYGRLQILLAIGAFGVLGFVFGMTKQPIYEAQGILQIEQKAGVLNVPSGMEDLIGGSGQSNAYRSLAEIQIMKSRSVMQIAAEALQLDLFFEPKRLPILGLLPQRMGLPYPNIPFLAPYQWGNESLAISSLVIPEGLRGKKFEITTTADGYVLRTPDGTEYAGVVGKTLEIKSLGVSLLVSEIKGPAGREYKIFRTEYEDVVAQMQSRFGAVETPANSSIIRITYKDVEPRRAEDILNAIANAYLKQDVERSAQEAMNSLRFIEEQLPVALRAVEEAQASLNAYRSNANSIDVDFETRSVLERETRLENELSALDLREAEYKGRYTTTHPLYETLMEERQELQAQLAEVRELSRSLPDTQKDIYNITRDLKVSQEVYVQLLNRQQELQVVEAATVGSVRVIDKALSSDLHVQPNTGVITAASMVIGAVISSLIVIGRTIISRGVIDTMELEKIGMQVYGIIPILKDTKKAKMLDSGLALDIREVSESMKSLRTALHFGLSGSSTKIIALTSAHPAAGKSFCARNLAAAYAEAGNRVCLIDADMRKGGQAKQMGLKMRKGLSEVLSGSFGVEQALQAGPTNGLYVMASGAVPPNPSELLMSPRFEEMLSIISKVVDIIILDAPPVLAVTDPLIIAKSANSTLFVVRQLVTRMPEIVEAQRLFDLNSVKIAGSILNAVDADKSKRYGRYGYGNYGYTYRYDYYS